MNEVLSGNKPLQFQVSIETKSAIILGLVIFVAIVGAYFFTKATN